MECERLKDIEFRENIGKRVYARFLARDVSVRLQKDKVTKFITFNMVDMDVVVEAKIFGVTEEVISKMLNGTTYNAAIDIKSYDKAPCGYSCIIYDIERSEYSSEYFVEWTDKIEEKRKTIENALGFINNTVYGKLTYQILIKHWNKFAVWTAAKGQHHTQLGGLMAHTAEVVDMCDWLAEYFNEIYGDLFINKALLLSAALLHDVGKTTELLVDSSTGSVEYSIEAALSTHIMNILSEVDIQAHELGIGIQKYEINEIDEEEPTKPEIQLTEEKEALALLKHCLAAHHGKLEYGSPILPNIPEALLLNIIDNLDAEMFKYNKAFKTIDAGKSFTSWNGGEMKTTYKESNK